MSPPSIPSVATEQQEEGGDSIRASAAKNLERPETFELRGEALALSLSCNVLSKTYQVIQILPIIASSKPTVNIWFSAGNGRFL